MKNLNITGQELKELTINRLLQNDNESDLFFLDYIDLKEGNFINCDFDEFLNENYNELDIYDLECVILDNLKNNISYLD